MKSFEKWFPVVFASPFLFATTTFEALSFISELARWLVLGIALVFAYLNGFARGQRGRLGMVGIDYTAMLVLAFFALTALWAIAPSYSLQRTISLGLLYGAAFWWAWGYADRFGDKLLLQLFLTTITVVLGINLFVFGVLSPGAIVSRRFQGFFENPNNIGLICSVALPLVFSELLSKRGRWEWISFLVLLLSLLACGSRTGLISAAAGIMIIWGIRAGRGNWIAITLGVLFAGFAVSLSLTSFFDDNIRRGHSLETLSNRTFFWELAKELYIPKRPWIGHGFGTDGLIHDHYGITLSDMKLRGYGVMSSYYGLAVAVGIPGAIAFFSLLVFSTLTRLRRYWRDSHIVALSATIVAGLLVGITESAIYSVGNCFAYLFWICFALMIRRTVYRERSIRLGQGGALKRPRKPMRKARSRPRSNPISQPSPSEN